MTGSNDTDLKSMVTDFASKAKSALGLEGSGTKEGRRLNIGIIGCGRIGRTHAYTIVHRLQNANLVCVSDVFESAATSCAQQFHVPMACTDPEDLINNSAVEAVIVCSPTDTHAQIIRSASKAKKHIFCEKPVDKDLAVIDDLTKVVRDSGVKFFLGFQRRFDVHFQRARSTREDGSIGSPVKLHLVSRDPAPPPIGYLKQSGGLFLDMSSHDFDMARFLMGSDITEITAVAHAHNGDIAEIGDFDQTMATVRFENGGIGVIDNARSCALGYDQRAELVGEKGSTFVGNVVPNMCSMTNKDGHHSDAPLDFFMERYAEAYVTEMNTFIDVVLNDKEVPVSIEDGRLTVIYAAAANLSVKEKRTVKISEIDPKAKY